LAECPGVAIKMSERVVIAESLPSTVKII
jgi:hypothetical protein